MKRALVFDTETTGLIIPGAPLEKQPKIIELALILLHVDESFEGGVIAPLDGEASWLINPGEPLSDVITRITGLKDDDLKGQPSFVEVLPKIMPWFLGVDMLVAHDLPFDLGMLTNELRRCGKEFAFPYPPKQLDTVAAFHPVLGRRAKLTELYKRVLGKPLPQKHRALDDTRALAEIVMKERLSGLMGGATPTQEQKEKKAHMVIVCDHHCDDAISVFTKPERALNWAKQCVDRYLRKRGEVRDPYDDQLTPSMRANGWSFFHKLSDEGDSVRVEMIDLNRQRG